jgi:hypothetical protein
MENYCLQLWNVIKTADYALFKELYLPGVILFAVVYFGVCFFYLFLKLTVFRKKKCLGIKISDDSGDLFISSTAITDLVKSLKSIFPTIEVSKLDLRPTKEAYEMNLQVTYDLRGESLSEQVIKLRQQILADVEKVFGITSITKINISLKKTKSGIGRDKYQPQPILQEGHEEVVIEPISENLTSEHNDEAEVK